VTFGFVERETVALGLRLRWLCDQNATLKLVSSQAQERIDGPREYLGGIAHDREMLMILATDRRRRMQSDGRPRFDLTNEEIERSTRIAMRIANASKSQAEARGSANTRLSA
jgi:hypothetical protein